MEPPRGGTGERVADGMLAVACAVLAVVSVTSPAASSPYQFPRADGRLITLAVGSAVLLTVRRRWPLTVCLGVSSLVFTIGAERWNAGSTPAFVLVALYTVAAGRDRRAAAVGLGFAYAGATVLVGLRAPYFEHPVVALFFLALTGAWSLGRWVRHRRAQRVAALTLAVAAERASASQVERAVLSERLHIARELHDVVSHTLTVIAVQSGTARLRLAQRAGSDNRNLTALAAIESSSRDALGDLRRLLGVLRADQFPEEPHPSVPMPGDDGRFTSRVLEGWVDATVAATLAALGIGLAFVDSSSTDYQFPSPTVVLIALVLLGSLPLAFRRRQPVPVFLVCTVCSVSVGLLGWNPDWPALAAYVALYTVSAWRPPLLATACWLLCVGGEVLLWTSPLPHSETFGSVPGLQSLVPFLLGLAVRRWRHQQAEALARALETQRAQAAVATRAAFEERMRIAEEMHDVVAHTLSAIAVQSAVLRHRQEGSAGPDADADAAVAIDEASRLALDDLRRMLDVFHDEARPATASLSPTPRLAELSLLVSAHRASHGPVELTIGPGVLDLPDSVQVTAFRLVQESLTNVRKHAGGAAALVAVSVDHHDVVVHIEDVGSVDRARRASTKALLDVGPARGFGLVGMRERVEMFGGRLEAGPLSTGGFRVKARLPIAAESPVVV